MKTLQTLLMIFWTIISFAQNLESITPPAYQGGNEQFFYFLGANMKYPISARDNNVSGVVYLSFIIDTNGTLDSLWVAKETDKRLVDEVFKTINQMGKWTPAKIENKKVRSQINFPIGFYLKQNQNSVVIPENYNQQIANIGHIMTLDEFRLTEYSVPIFYGNFNFDNNYQNGVDAYNKGNYQEALNYFNVLYRGDPINPDILFNRAMAKFKLGKIKAACKDWERAEKFGDKQAGEYYKKNCKE